MNLSPDPRQLKSKVTLKILNAPESGFFSGDYTAASIVKSQDNLNVLNYDFETKFVYQDGSSESKYSKRLKVLSSLQNARIPEVNTAISASSCTFAFGSIVPGETDPVLNRLQGPKYDVNFIDDPLLGEVNSPSETFQDKSQHVPKIPFADKGNILTTYNIWNIVDGGTDAYKYIGPANVDANTGTLRTIKSPSYGAQIEVASELRNTTIKRIFPTYLDAVYQKQAKVINPDGTEEFIKSTGLNGNNGFHINFSVSNMQLNTSALRIEVQPREANYNYINNFVIEFKIDSKPVIKIFDPYTNDYIKQTDIIAPVLDKTSMDSYDVYVHFAGPNLLIGFSPDISKWNTIINISNREVFCPPLTDVYIYLSNVNLKFRYSAIIFNNFNNDQPQGYRKNYVVAELRYSKSKIPNIADFIKKLKKSFEDASYRLNSSPQNIGYNPSNPIDKNISYFADLRLPVDFHQFDDNVPYRFPIGKSADPDKQTVYFKLFYNTTIEGPAYLQIETPHPGVLAGDLAGYKFVNPILNKLFYDVGDITSWLEGWNVSCNSEGSNLSKITKTATITLKNIDSAEGQKFIDAIENNLLVVSIDAGYTQDNLYTYFQGFITNTTYSRSGNDSTFTLNCTDIASFTLSNIFFDKNMLIAGMRHDLAIDSIMACSGFWSYYLRNNSDLANGSQIYGIDLRLNSTSVNNQDLIKLNPLDKIYDKLLILLERLNNPYSLPTFRWAENFGFILECRNNYVDNDLKFTGLNSNGNQYLFQSNSTNANNFMALYEKDIHGLLKDQYTIRTSMQNLSAGVRVFGSSITGFLADERYSPFSVSIDNLPVQVQLDLANYLAQAPRNPSQSSYVGFKKYLNWATQRNEIPDYTVLKRITDSYELVSKTPISEISFDCYVSKPLNCHGKFKINVFLGNTSNATDLYVYKSVDYRYDKANNLITATVVGTNMPINISGG